MQPNGDCTPEQLAALAKLKYVSDAEAGMLRRRAGRGFVYLQSKGRRVTKDADVRRIEALVIPPAWENVWICRNATGHLQATGIDEKGRKQYLYHARWRDVSNLVKFRKLLPFGEILPRIRSKTRRYTRARTHSREKVSALLVELLDRTAIRIGNEEYVRSNNSFGLSTLRKRHVKLKGATISFRFRAKGGQPHELEFKSLRLSRLLTKCLETPGPNLFACEITSTDIAANGAAPKYGPITSNDVNQFLQQITDYPFTAKDFRMWKATAIAAGHLYRNRRARSKTKRTSHVQEAVAMAAERLGNTKTVCRKYYIHPAILDAFVDGRFQKISESLRVSESKWLSADEQALLKILSRLESGRRKRRKRPQGK